MKNFIMNYNILFIILLLETVFFLLLFLVVIKKYVKSVATKISEITSLKFKNEMYSYLVKWALSEHRTTGKKNLFIGDKNMNELLEECFYKKRISCNCFTFMTLNEMREEYSENVVLLKNNYDAIIVTDVGNFLYVQKYLINRGLPYEKIRSLRDVLFYDIQGAKDEKDRLF